MRFAGVEQGPDAVILEVAAAESDPLDALDQVVERLCWSVALPGQMEVGDLGETLANRLSELLDLGRHLAFEAMSFELFEHRFGLVGVGGSIEVTQALFDPVGNGDLGAGIAQLEQ